MPKLQTDKMMIYWNAEIMKLLTNEIMKYLLELAGMAGICCDKQE